MGIWKIVSERANLYRQQRLASSPDNVRLGRGLDIAALVKKVRTEERPRRLLKQHSGLPAMRYVRRFEEPEPAFTCFKNFPVFHALCRICRSKIVHADHF